MKIRQIETFLAVAEAASFRRAAEVLHRSQSAVSAHVQQLEEELGLPLLERTTRRVSLTPGGKVLLGRCKSLMADLNAVAQELKEEATLRRGRVSIGTSPSISTHRLPPIVAAYQVQYPGITLELHEAFASRMYDDVLERVTDFAIGPRVDGLKDFDIRTVIVDPVVAVLPATKPWLDRKTVRLDDIAREPHLAMPRGTAIRAVIEDSFRRRGVVFEPRFEVIHQQTLFSLVEAGLGVTVLPLMSVPPQRGNYVVARLRTPEITRDVCLVTLKGKSLTPAAARCAEMIVSTLQAQFRRK
ncbi:LysR substrate-binding domain-containing protein [Ramlibacter sp.]|uniref:LysR family transcriptional regulator n=1 Tax=Ramlibacter sp. TaxID=1917967 RepID=UPI003D13F278